MDPPKKKARTSLRTSKITKKTIQTLPLSIMQSETPVQPSPVPAPQLPEINIDYTRLATEILKQQHDKLALEIMKQQPQTQMALNRNVLTANTMPQMQDPWATTHQPVFEIPFLEEEKKSTDTPLCLGTVYEDNCDDKWRKVLETSKTGEELFGTKADLIDAISHGADLRIYFGTYATSTQNAQTVNGEVCTQALMHVSKAGWDSFPSKVYWWFLNVSTSGHMHMSRWYVGKHQLVSETKTTQQVTWFVRELDSCTASDPEPIYCNEADGTTAFGNKESLIHAIGHGADIRLVTGTPEREYSTPFSNIGFSDSMVSGQSVWHVSQTTSGNHIEFQSDAYWWFTIFSTDGTRDMSRWSVGSHIDRGHSNDKQFMQWFVGPWWTLAYKHDASGNGIQGSLDFLRSALLNGRRVKLVIDGYSIEPDNLQIKNGHVSGQFLGQVSKNTMKSIKYFQDNAYWNWQLVSTTGNSDTIRYNVGDTTFRGGKSDKMAASWYIDTRAWTHILSTSSTGVATYGEKSALVNAIKDGAMLRCIIKFPRETLIIQADNVTVEGVDVAGQALRTVSYSSGNVRMFMSDPYWWFIIATTQGNIRTTKWTVGKHVSRGNETLNAPIDWYIY